MKYRESGMPNEELWDTFFNPTEILNQMDINGTIRTLLDIGCGYGTFLIPAAKLVSDTVVGIDIESEMIEACRKKIDDQNIDNIELLYGDISTAETIKALGKFKGEIDYICLFNILHCEQPMVLLNAAFRILNNGGKIGVMHWKYEKTPRGPSMEIRPTPEIINEWALKSGFILEKYVELPPYHYGLVFIENQ
jgi:ubiquinone/menaquinone biosynthesis C-methylase UbiE